MKDNYWSYNELIPATKKELEKLLEYEIWMFNKTCSQINLMNWASKPKNDAEKFERNLLVESIATHTRILVEFFYDINDKDKKHKNDIIAQEFMPQNVNWKELRPLKTEVLEFTKNKANKQLAHLTRWRLKLKRDDKKGWDIQQIKMDIENVIKKFKEIKN